MRLAILDLGTNTFHLLIVDVSGRKVHQIYKSKFAVKLGEGAIHKNRIARVPFSRGIDALKYYKKIIDRHKAERIVAYGTSAIRSAENGNDFIARAKAEAGIPIKIISGSKEAELIYYGVRECINLRGKPALIIDIGGGSTEFIIADDKKIYWKRSFNIGAARLLEMFHPSDPITKEEISSIQLYLEKELRSLAVACGRYKITKLIGSSGSFDTFAEMAGYRFYRRNLIREVNSFKFNMDEFYKLHEIILASTLEKRKKMKGLIAMRVDMIVIAAICTEYILRKFDIKQMYLSKYALKEGALWEQAIKMKNEY